MNEDERIKQTKDRLRIFFILYFLGEKYHNLDEPDHKLVLEGEMKIQKVHFLLRNPDYLAYELLNLVEENKASHYDIKEIVKNIFVQQEPILRRDEMEKFLYGAYEDIDGAISFLKSLGLVEFSSQKRSDLRTVKKSYYVTDLGVQKIADGLEAHSSLYWYRERCELINKYFGQMSGTELADRHYKIDPYLKAQHGTPITNVEELVQQKFLRLYGEKLT